MGNRNKALGNNAERWVAWIMSQGTGLNWERVPTSGARIGGRNAGRIVSMSKNQILLSKGDLIPPDEFANVYVEVKRRQGFDFRGLFDVHGEVDSWIDQCFANFEEVGAKALLIVVKIPRKAAFVFTPVCQHSREGLVGLDYLHQKSGKWFRMESFNKEWVEKRKDDLRRLSDSGGDPVQSSQLS